MTRRKPHPDPPSFDGSTSIPLALAVALMDRETQQRLAVFLRGLGAARLGLSDPFSIAEADRGDPEAGK